MMATTETPVATEKQLQSALKDAAERLGFLVYHTWRSDHSPAGFPDLVCCHPRTGRVMVIEVKGPRGRVSSAQQRWICALTACGIPAFVVFPEDEDRILGLLAEWGCQEP